MKLIYISFLLFFVLNCSKPSKNSLIKKEYLEEVLKIVEEHSINRDSINFDKIKESTYEKLKYTDSLKDCYPIIQSVLKDLNDNHSFFMTKDQVDKWQSTSKTDINSESITFTGKLLSNNIGYLHLKGFSSGDSISIQKYSDSLQHKIKSIDNENIKGWILDLRENTGGNCWPMITGLGPLLGNGICGYFIDNKEQKASWFYRDGGSGIDSTIITQVSKKPYKLIKGSKPIAVLTGSKTCSSGEVLVTAFHNKSNTKSFGERTAGLSTGNVNFKLSDGSMILLTTSIYADRHENIFGNEIIPDEIISFSYESIGEPNDLVIKRAINWMSQKTKN